MLEAISFSLPRVCSVSVVLLILCLLLQDIPDEAVVTTCGHIFCRQCIQEQLATGDDNCCPVTKCRKSLNTSAVFTIASLSLSESGEGSSSEITSVLEKMVQEVPNAEAVAWKTSSKIDAVIDTLNALPPISVVEVKSDVHHSSTAIEASKSEDRSDIRRILQKALADSVLKDQPMLQEVRSAGFGGPPDMPGNESRRILQKAVADSVLKEQPMLQEVGSAGFGGPPDMPGIESSVKVENGVKDEFIADTVGQQIVVPSDVMVKRTVVTEKAIVFSQWTSMLDLLEAKLKEANFNYRRLDGTMSVLARDRAVSEFKTMPEV